MPKKKTNNKNVSQEKKGQLDFILLITVLILLALGIIMVLSASSPTALTNFRE